METNVSISAQKRRSDFGTFQMTARDLAILTWIGEQYAIRVDHLQVLAGREADHDLKEPGILSEPGVRRLYNRWAKAGWIEKRKLLAHDPIWVWLSKRGIAETGLDFPAHTPSVGRLAHMHAVNGVRLYVENKLGTEAKWISDRQVNIERKAEKKRHLVDGELFYEETHIALEVELTLKKRARLDSILRELKRDYAAVWYFATEECYNPLENAIQAVPGHEETFVLYRLSEVLGGNG